MAAARRINSEAPKKFLLRGWLLYLLPLPLLPATIIALFSDHTVVAIARAIGFAMAMCAATLVRKGIRLEEEGKLRRFKRRASTIPYRLIGGVVLSVAMFIVSYWGISGSNGLIESTLIALATMLGCYLYYDFDPARDKRASQC